MAELTYRQMNIEKCRAIERAYNERNKEKKRIDVKAWYEKNREKSMETKRAWYRKNKEKSIASSKLWHDNNKERYHAISKTWRDNNIEKNKALQRDWSQRNKEKVIQQSAIRRARLKNATIIKFTIKQLRERLSVFGGKCWICGGIANQIDHVIPISKGGPHVLSNLRPACASCNARKNNLLIHKKLLHG